MLRAWRGVCDQAGVGGRAASVMNHTAWKEWRKRESARARKVRRLVEGIARMRAFAKLIVLPGIKQLKLAKVRAAFRAAAIRRAVLRARVRRVGRRATGLMLMARARDASRYGGRAARVSTTMASVNSLLCDYAASRTKLVTAPGASKARLVRAMAIGPTLLAWVDSFDGRGYG